MTTRAVTEMKNKQTRRLRDFGHPLRWRKTGAASYLGTCSNCGGQVECDEYGTHWRGGAPGQPPSLLKWMGVNLIRRCPGSAR